MALTISCTLDHDIKRSLLSSCVGLHIKHPYYRLRPKLLCLNLYAFSTIRLAGRQIYPSIYPILSVQKYVQRFFTEKLLNVDSGCWDFGKIYFSLYTTLYCLNSFLCVLYFVRRTMHYKFTGNSKGLEIT